MGLQHIPLDTVEVGRMTKRNAVMVVLLTVAAGVAGAGFPSSWAQTSDAQSAIVKSSGTIKTINGNALTLAPASGPEVAVTVAPMAKILRLAPGDKDLKNATPLQLGDLKVGDTVRARGHAAGNGIDALEVLVITSSAVDAVKEQMRQDWQKRGAGGIVESVDVASGNVSLSIPGGAGKKTVVVHTGKATVIYRYSPDSSKPEEAKPGTVQDIHVDDQLRVLGNRSADGSEITAEQIYTGGFPQFAAVVKSVDASTGVLSVQDLGTKKTVQVKVTADSQLHKISPEMAQGFAMRLKGAMPPGVPGSGSNASAGSAAGNRPATAGSGGMSAGNGGSAASTGGPGGGMRRGGGPPDLTRMLSRLPSSTLAELDLKKGDAVIILSTEGTPTGARTAITMLSGVEPILQAAPNASQAMMLTPWTLGGAPGGDAAQ